MNNAVRWSLAAIGLLGFASSFVHPFGDVKGQHSPAPLFAGAETNPAVTRMVERSCQNCHSERTEWPWYSYVAPFSYLIEKDVAHGRSHMNLSRWSTYTEDEQTELLTRLRVEVRNHRMPLPQYLVLHPGAKLSDSEAAQLYEWVRSERGRVRKNARSKQGPTD